MVKAIRVGNEARACQPNPRPGQHTLLVATDRATPAFMIRYYPALMSPTADAAGFNIAFPDFQGCTASGATVSNAVTNGADALQSHVEAIEARGGDIPHPSALEVPAPAWLGAGVDWIRVMVPVSVQAET